MLVAKSSKGLQTEQKCVHDSVKFKTTTTKLIG